MNFSDPHNISFWTTSILRTLLKLKLKVTCLQFIYVHDIVFYYAQQEQ